MNVSRYSVSGTIQISGTTAMFWQSSLVAASSRPVPVSGSRIHISGSPMPDLKVRPAATEAEPSDGADSTEAGSSDPATGCRAAAILITLVADHPQSAQNTTN